MPIFWNDGAGHLLPMMQPKGGSELRDLAAADLNGDGRTADSADGTATILLSRAKGGFTTPYTAAVGKRPRSVVAATSTPTGGGSCGRQGRFGLVDPAQPALRRQGDLLAYRAGFSLTILTRMG